MRLSGQWGLPRFLQVGKGYTLEATGYKPDGNSVSPATATYALYDADGAAVVAPVAATVAGSVVTHPLASTWSDSTSLPQTWWREVWELTGGTVGDSPQRLERLVIPCRSEPQPVITVAALYKLHPVWRRQIPKAYGPPASVDDPINDAWEEMIRTMLGNAVWVNRVLNWFSFADVHKYWAASLVCDAFQTDQPGASRWASLGEKYLERATSELETKLALLVDNNEDGTADNGGELVEAEPELFLTEEPRALGSYHLGGYYPGSY